MDDRMICKRCSSNRICRMGAKCSDLFHVTLLDGLPEGETAPAKEHDGYVPGDLGIGEGDYIEFDWYLQCGQIQGDFPLPPSNLEKRPMCGLCARVFEPSDDGDPEPLCPRCAAR